MEKRDLKSGRLIEIQDIIFPLAFTRTAFGLFLDMPSSIVNECCHLIPEIDQLKVLHSVTHALFLFLHREKNQCRSQSENAWDILTASQSDEARVTPFCTIAELSTWPNRYFSSSFSIIPG